MISSLLQRKAHTDVWACGFLYLLCLFIHFSAVLLHSVMVTILGMLFYILLSFLFVRRRYWAEIKLKRPEKLIRLLYFIPVLFSIVIFFYLIQTVIFGLSDSNFFVVLARQQLQYGFLNRTNMWTYFPITAIGFASLPLSEDIFFRGLILRVFEGKYSPLRANIIQSTLFSFVHIAYFWTTEIGVPILIPLFAWVFVSGLIYGWAAQKSKSVFSSMLVHALNDVFTMFLVYLLVMSRIG